MSVAYHSLGSGQQPRYRMYGRAREERGGGQGGDDRAAHSAWLLHAMSATRWSAKSACGECMR